MEQRAQGLHHSFSTPSSHKWLFAQNKAESENFAKGSRILFLAGNPWEWSIIWIILSRNTLPAETQGSLLIGLGSPLHPLSDVFWLCYYKPTSKIVQVSSEHLLSAQQYNKWMPLPCCNHPSPPSLCPQHKVHPPMCRNLDPRIVRNHLSLSRTDSD